MNAFTVLPMSQAIKLTAGEVFEGEITVANPADATADFEYEVAVAPYSVIGEDYTADLTSLKDSTMMVDWVTLEKTSGTLAPNETQKIRFKITVPETAPVGGQYAAITVRSAEPAKEDAENGVKNVFEIASVLFADVTGETIHVGEIVENKVPSFSASNPAEVTAVFTNSGNVHEEAVTKITVKNVLTGEQIFPRNEAEAGGDIEYIMPGTTRHLTREVNGLSDLGVFEVTQTIQYMGEVSTASTKLVMCPIWFMVLVALTVGAVIFTIFKTFKKRRVEKII